MAVVPGWRWFQNGGDTCRSEAEVYVDEAQVLLQLLDVLGGKGGGYQTVILYNA